MIKKFGYVASALAATATIAVASSISVPWYVDTAPEANQVPGKAAGVTGIVYLKSNRTDTLTCEITYINQDGAVIGPFSPNNTFTMAPLSAVAFRPVVTDPDVVTTDPRTGLLGKNGGQEGNQGVLVPNRPRSVDTNTPIPGTNNVIDTKKNGALSISWTGGARDVQGFASYFQTGPDPTTGATVTMSYAYTLPEGG